MPPLLDSLECDKKKTNDKITHSQIDAKKKNTNKPEERIKSFTYFGDRKLHLRHDFAN